ncbi:hypothetical protein [Nocardia sp. NPDC059239]|uniref:hypothetical protein n=1 Tax=unclassified Nocardia TaxID=2637762 RepID=UPI0036B724DF
MTFPDHTIRPGAALDADGRYRGLERGPAEPRSARTELAPGATLDPGATVARFVQLTDFQIADPVSPGRLTFLHGLAGRPGWEFMFPAYRPQEPVALQAFEATIRTLRELGTDTIDFVVTTGDNIDSAQSNELSALFALLDGDTVLDPNFGATETRTLPAYAVSAEFYNPEPESRDVYKREHGFPDVPGLLAAAAGPFRTRGLGVPWLACFGNHDCLVQGRAPVTAEYQALVTGDSAPTALGIDPPADPIRRYLPDPTVLSQGPAVPIAARTDRRVISPAEYVRAHLDSPTEPRGHGFTEQNLIEGTTYYSYDAVPGVRMIVLDSTHPAGHVTGSIGARQWGWLVDQLIAAHSSYRGEDGAIVRTGNRDRAVIIASHHGLGMLTNTTPDPDGETRYLAADLEALLHRFGNVVLWIAGHEHRNEVTPRHRPDPQEDPAGGFWHVLTSGLCEWPCQTRLLELVLPQQDSNHLIIRSTMIDHSAPERPGPALELLDLASLHRELSFNEPTRVGGPHSAGTPADRTVDLIVPVPPALLASLRGAIASSERPSTGDHDGNAVVLGLS